jgi:Fanconi anemia group M protein
MALYNIFSRIKQRKTKKSKTPLIIVDIHEKNSLVISELYSSRQARIELRALKIGDYLIGNIIIERKTVQDFISSMLNKRLVEQLNQMKKYKKSLLIIEGIDEESIYPKNSKLNPNAIRGFILSIINHHQIPIIFTKNYRDTAGYLIILSKQILKKYSEPTLHNRIAKSKKEQKKYILESFPNIGPITAKKLLEKFKTLDRIFNAGEEELKDILRNKTAYFKDLITN